MLVLLGTLRHFFCCNTWNTYICLTFLEVTTSGRLLLLSFQWSDMVQCTMAPTFLWLGISEYPWWVIPSNSQILWVEILAVFFGYLHRSSIYFVLPLNSLGPWLLVPRLPWSCRGQIGFFLWPRTTLMVFGISFHTRLRMAPSSSLLGNCCCSRIIWTIGSFPSLFHRSVRRLTTCLLIYGLLFLFVHRFVDDRPIYNLRVSLKLYVSFSKIR